MSYFVEHDRRGLYVEFKGMRFRGTYMPALGTEVDGLEYTMRIRPDGREFYRSLKLVDYPELELTRL